MPNRSLNVTFCAYDAAGAVGGPASWILRLLPGLREHDIKPHCLVLTWGSPESVSGSPVSGPLVAGLREAGVDHQVHACEGNTQQRITWILQQVNQSPTNVFVPNLVVPAFYAGRWVKSAGIATVGVLHSDDPFYRAIQDEFAFGPTPLALSSLVCVSKELERQIESRGPTNTRAVRIPYGVPIPNQSVQHRQDRLRVAFVGRLAEKQKRISDVATAFCRIVAEIPGTEAVIYGSGPDHANVEAMLKSKGATLPVTLGGRIPSDQIQQRLADCDAVVLLSDYEGLPIAILEAMACGVVPVCLQMRSGIGELIQHEATGLMVTDRGDDFVAAIRRLKESPKLLAELSAGARDLVQREFALSRCTQRWADLLWSLDNKQRGPARIPIPKKFKLPPVNPVLAPEDPRGQDVAWWKQKLRKSRKTAGMIRRKVFGISATSQPSNFGNGNG